MLLLFEWIRGVWDIVLEAAPWLLGGFVIAGVVHVLLPANRVASSLGQPGLAGVVKASLLGIPLPLCSCSVIPVASAIRKRGASRGATASFLVSTPETGVDSIAISWGLLGPFLAVIRPVAALVTALVAGGLIDALDRASTPGRPDKGSQDDGDRCGCDDPRSSDRGGVVAKIRSVMRYGLIEMFDDLSPWLVAGFGLAGLVSAMVPEGFLELWIGSGIGAMAVMVVAGLPLYVCATSSTPIAAALIAKGLSPGAALVFLLTGPATNVATILIVARDLGTVSVLIYLASIALVAIGFGLLADAVIASWPVEMVGNGLVASWSKPFEVVSAVVLIVLMLNGLVNRIRTRNVRCSQ